MGTISMMHGNRQILLSGKSPRVLVDGQPPTHVEGVLVDADGQFLRIWPDEIYSHSFRLDLSPDAAELLTGPVDHLHDAIYANAAKLADCRD